MTMMDAEFAYAEPGKQNLIDAIRPDGLTFCFGETEEEIKRRYPLAVKVKIEEWLKEAASRQQSPIVWEVTTAESYENMLNVLPPIDWAGGYFLVGEPTDHDITTGQPRYTAMRQQGEKFYTSSRPNHPAGIEGYQGGEMTKTDDSSRAATPIIRIIVEVLTRPRDRNGNGYWSVRLTDTNTRASVQFQDIGGPRNMEPALFALGLQFGEFYAVEVELPSARYNSTVRQWPYYPDHKEATTKFAEVVSAVVCPDGDACPDPLCQKLRYQVRAR